MYTRRLQIALIYRCVIETVYARAPLIGRTFFKINTAPEWKARRFLEYKTARKRCFTFRWNMNYLCILAIVINVFQMLSGRNFPRKRKFYHVIVLHTRRSICVLPKMYYRGNHAHTRESRNLLFYF